MHKKLALLAALAVPSLALANPYIIAGGGTVNADMTDLENNYAGAHTTNDNFGRALVGVGADLSPNVGVEAVYLTEGQVSVQNSTNKDVLKNSGVQFALLGKAPLTPQLTVFGKISANYMDVTWDYTNVSGTTSNEDNKFQLGYGIGLNYQFTDAVAGRLQVERIQMRDPVADPLGGPSINNDQDMASVAFMFSF
ncbi:MAG TPA: outer membrane beta-barrel protein [Moraxellaceae bacterium]|nr:outer membrane beta-barrel protein [Moraxellaceae bacterium]